MRWLAHFSIFALFCASCATAPILPTAPTLPFGEFVDQVLDPLSGKIADEHIQQAQADLKAGQLSPVLLTLLGSAFGPGGTVAGAGLANLQTATIDQKSAQLDTRRLPLKKELLALFTSRAKAESDHYSVCVEGAERRYGVQSGKFVRLADGQGPCEVTALKTLAKGGGL
jgi:hypothetical protein